MEVQGPARLMLIISAAIGGFALLLLIISVGTTTWLDDGNGDTIGLFRKCYGDSYKATTSDYAPGNCYSENRVTQGGLSVFGLLLLVFGIVAIIAAIFLQNEYVLFGGLVLFYFSSMFVMSAYATWGSYSRDFYSYAFPYGSNSINASHTSMGASYHLCVASHYFLWTALTILAFGAGWVFSKGRNEQGS